MNDDIIYKLPSQIMQHHGEEIRAHDWGTRSDAVFRFGGDAFHLELIMRDGQRIVRPATIGSANRLRKYALTLGPDVAPNPDEMAAILQKRNDLKEPA